MLVFDARNALKGVGAANVVRAHAREIADVVSHRHLTQAQAARVLGTTQPKVSALYAGRLAGFSMERFIRFLNALDRDVCIVVTPKPRGRARATTRVAGPASEP